MLFDVPVAVPESTSRWPSDAEITLALTPGLLEAEFIAFAIPCSVLSLESTLIEMADVPTLILSAPVPTVAPVPATGAEVSVCALARFCTASEYVPATAPEVAVAVATVLSATLASKVDKLPA
jgi:hypothetical protein